MKHLETLINNMAMPQQRKQHGQNLKALLSSSAQWVQVKHVDAFTVPLYQRLTYSLNTDQDPFSTFPALSDEVCDRVLALKVNPQKWKHFESIEEYQIISQVITCELPGSLYYLINNYTPPERCIGLSSGCKEFIHPDIEKQIETCTPEATFKELILDYLWSTNNKKIYPQSGI